MKRRTFIITATTLGLGALVTTAAIAHGPGYGGQMGGGQGPMGGGYHMKGHGGYGMRDGSGPRADCPTGRTLDKPLTVEDVRAKFEKRLEWRGNKNLKVGKVEEKDDKTIVAEIVTVDDSLVRRIEVDKLTGRHTPVD